MGMTRLDDARLAAPEKQYGVTLTRKRSAAGQGGDRGSDQDASRNANQGATPPPPGSAQ
jgi:hypothetical protein